jgi:hypothetical protein
VFSKPVMFKVEILKAAATPSRYASGVIMTLVKGAQSSFRGKQFVLDEDAPANCSLLDVCDLLRRNYRLDQAITYPSTPSSATAFATNISGGKNPSLPSPASATTARFM